MTDVFDLSNSDVWKTRTRSNAEKFKGLIARVKLCTVPWDAHWKDVIDWQSNEERDAYFETIEGPTVDIETNWNFKNLEIWKPGLGKHAGDLTVPLPYAEAIDYNYVAIELYEVPVPGSGTPHRREVYFYNLVGLESKAASTTLLALELDTWTTYWPSVRVAGINLNRGHYFHAKTPAQAFLSNPLDNSLGLTDIEPEFPALKPKVAHSELVSFSKSDPRVLIATTADFTDRRSWFTVIPRDPSDDPDARAVSFPAATTPGSMKAAWNRPANADRGGFNDMETVGLKTSVKQPTNGAGTPETLNVYSIAPADYPAFIAYARQNMAQIIPSIRAAFVVDGALINESSSFTQWGYSFKKVNQTADPKLVQSFAPTQAMFGYSPEARDFAKLYTGQFAKLEISNMQGQRAEISIEEIAQTLDVYARSSTLFPYLKLEALLDGVGGRGIKRYSVRPLSNVEAKSFGGKWEDYVFDINVPLYGITIAKDQEIAQASLAQREQAARSAKVSETTTKTIADMEWLTGTINATARFTSATASTELARTNESLSSDVRWTNEQYQIKTDTDIGKLTALKDYRNETAAITNVFTNAIDSANLLSANELKNIELNYDIETRNYNIEWENTKRSAGVSASGLTLGPRISEQHWRLAAKKEMENAADLVKNEMRNRFLESWESKSTLFDAGRAAATSTSAMSIMTSAKVAGLGAIGSGFSSLPGATIGSTIDGSAVSADGIGNFSPGAISGISLLSIVDRWIAYEINSIVWELQKKQTNILYANYANEEMEQNGTTAGYIGPGVKVVEYNVNRKLSSISLDYDLKMITIDLDKNVATQDDLIARTYGLTATQASYGVKVAWENAEDVAMSAQRTALDTKALGQEINEDNLDLQTEIAGRNKTTSKFIQQANYDQDISNIVQRRNTRYDIGLSDYTLRNTIIGDNYFTSTQNNGRAVQIERDSLDNSLAVSQLSAEVALGKARGDWTASLLGSVQGAPSEQGESSGKGWVDVWGQRGIEVRVLRCSDAVAEQAASTFALFGYRASGLFIQNPDISMMTGFTYWQGEGLWLIADRINESNKAIFRSIFADGVRIWRSPSVIFNIDVNSNVPA